MSVGRLQKEYKMILKDPIPYVYITPEPENWHVWHFIIHSLPDDSPYRYGIYYGELILPTNYPMAPPSIKVHTPNGRFEPGKKICTSMTSYHPESWSPIWTISTIMSGFISFMLSEERSTGCIRTSNSVRVQLAKESLEYNDRFPQYKLLLSEKVEKIMCRRAEESALGSDGADGGQVGDLKNQGNRASNYLVLASLVVIVIAWVYVSQIKSANS
jgi:ubiquitin-conjugating enzyme E2 J2